MESKSITTLNKMTPHLQPISTMLSPAEEKNKQLQAQIADLLGQINHSETRHKEAINNLTRRHKNQYQELDELYAESITTVRNLADKLHDAQVKLDKFQNLEDAAKQADIATETDIAEIRSKLRLKDGAFRQMQGYLFSLKTSRPEISTQIENLIEIIQKGLDI